MDLRHYFDYAPGLLKIPEIVLALILLVLTRVGLDDGFFPWGKTVDQAALGYTVAYGFFVVIGFQLIAFLAGERAPLLSAVASTIMSPCYLALAIVHFVTWKERKLWEEAYEIAMVMGSLAVVQALLVTADAFLSAKVYFDSRQKANMQKLQQPLPQSVYHPQMVQQHYPQVVVQRVS